MRKYILPIVMLVAAVSCNKVENIFRGDSDKVKIVIDGCEEYDNARSTVAINPKATANVTFNFGENDLLGVFPDVDYSQQLKLEVDGGNGKSFSGNTVGWLLNAEKSYAAYYPFNADYHQSPYNIVFSYEGQTQKGNGCAETNLAHLGKYTFLYSKPVTPSDNSATFVMKNASAFLHIRHFSKNGGTFTKMAISAKDGSKSIPTALKANLFPAGTGEVSDTVAVDGLSESIAINLEGDAADNGYSTGEKQNLNVWCALPPVNLSGKTLVFTFYDADGNVADFFEKQGQDMTLKNTGRWAIHNFIEQVYALKYHANADGATFADGTAEYKDIQAATGPSCEFKIIGTNKEPTRAEYKISGWSLTPDGGATLYHGDTKTLTNGTYTTSDKTEDLYAVWIEDTTPTYTISVDVSNDKGGTVSIGDTADTSKKVKKGDRVTINAVADSDSGYEFDCWKIGETVVKDDTDVPVGASYTFYASADASYTAYFKKAQPKADGSLPGIFSVSATKKVKFSQGNLQYQASTNTWRFAEHQYDFVGDGGTKAGNVTGSNNASASQTYSGWIDMFCWASSGYSTNRLSNEYYQPWSPAGSSSDKTKYYINGVSNTNLNGTSDWGYNKIQYLDETQWKEGAEGYWRTLEKAEWEHLLGNRSGNRYRHTKLTITDNNKKIVYQAVGLFIFKDGWDEDWKALSPDAYVKTGGFYNNTESLSYSTDALSELQFKTLTEKGAVFLPANGYYTSSSYFKDYLYYWTSSTHTTNLRCYHLKVTGSAVYTLTDAYIYQYRQSVRLVTDVPSE